MLAALCMYLKRPTVSVSETLDPGPPQHKILFPIETPLTNISRTGHNGLALWQAENTRRCASPRLQVQHLGKPCLR